MIARSTLIAFFLLALMLGWAGRVGAQGSARDRPLRISVNMFGEVTNPGRYDLPKGATVLDALAAAGGQKPEARLTAVKLIHATEGDLPSTDAIDMKAVLAGTKVAPILHQGDSLNFPRSVISIMY